MGRVIGLIALLVVAALGIAVGYFNAQTVTFDYLVGKTEISVIFLLLIALLSGVLLALVACTGHILALKAKVRRLKKNLRETEAELKNLRNLPLKDA